MSASSVSSISPPTSTRLPAHPNDTHHRINYRPTPLPSTHHFNNPPHRADHVLPSSSGLVGSARWLSEGEGTGGNRQGTSLSLSDGSDTDKEEGNREQSSGLTAAKARWQAMSGSSSGRQRVRRTHSSNQVQPARAKTDETVMETRSRQPSGHPLAPSEGIPLPDIQSLAATRISPDGSSIHELGSSRQPPTSSEQRQYLRPQVRRAGSSVTIDDLLNPDVPTSSATQSRQSVDGQLSRTSSRREGAIPDFEVGRGGDGIGGVGLPLDSDLSSEEQRDLEKRAKLENLRKILGCPMCPHDLRSQDKLLHQPITLHCGHTISSSHVSLPRLPLPDVSSAPSAEEVHDIMQAHQTRKLAMWTSVRCPLPVCRQHGQPEDDQDNDGALSAISTSQRERLRGQGVQYYPARPPPLEVETLADSEEAGVNNDRQLFDVTVGKALALVIREIGLQDAYAAASDADLAVDAVSQAEDTESEADADDEAGGEPESRGLSSTPLSRGAELHAVSSATLGLLRKSPSYSVTRSSSKRRRRSTRTESSPSDSDEQSTDGRPRLSGLQPWKVRQSRSRPAIGMNSTRQLSTANVDFEKELAGIVECDVCSQMLHEPVTTPCQHTFCAKCLARSLDHSSRCPLCRQNLPSFAFFQDHAVNKVLMSIILTAFPMEYEERKRAIEAEERDARLDTPIFVCALAFPGLPTILHVFEPRYRLMLRRCVESSNPRFGMVLPGRGAGNPGIAGLMEYGTMLEIKSIQMLPDGRSMVETMGSYRFKLLESGSLDGYTVGRTERIDDITPEDDEALERLSIQRTRNARNTAAAAAASGAAATGSPRDPSDSTEIPPRRPSPLRSISTDALNFQQQSMIPLESFPTTEPSTAELMATCQSFIEQLRSGSAPWLLQRLNNTYGPMPDTPSEFSYWMALVMPIDEYEKARLLPIRSPRLRLRLIVHWVEQLRSSWWFSSGCVVG